LSHFLLGQPTLGDIGTHSDEVYRAARFIPANFSLIGDPAHPTIREDHAKLVVQLLADMENPPELLGDGPPVFGMDPFQEFLMSRHPIFGSQTVESA
jgi:hypothetical protein